MDRHLTGYFVLFILAALANGFNVRDDGFGIFKGLGENPNFLKVMFTIIAIQALIVNCALIPLAPFEFIGNMFSCVPFGIAGWGIVALLAVTMIPVDLIRKACVAAIGSSASAEAAADAEENLDIAPVAVKVPKAEKAEEKPEKKAEEKPADKKESAPKQNSQNKQGGNKQGGSKKKKKKK